MEAAVARVRRTSRAPPPTPVDAIVIAPTTADLNLSEYLESSLRVPDLAIPEPYRLPPKISLSSLLAGEGSAVIRMMTSAGKIGAFLIDGGDLLGGEELRSAIEVGRKVFLIGEEKRKGMMKERFGHGEGGEEEFYWTRNMGSDAGLAEAWPDTEEDGYRIFRETMQNVFTRLEVVSESVYKILSENIGEHSKLRNLHKTQSVLCLRKYNNSQHSKTGSSKCYQSHILSLLAGDCHKWCLRSQEGSYSFTLPAGFVLITISKPFQEQCDGELKSYTGEIHPECSNDQPDPLLLEFMFSPPAIYQEPEHISRIISLVDQLLVMLSFALLYKLFG